MLFESNLLSADEARTMDVAYAYEDHKLARVLDFIVNLKLSSPEIDKISVEVNQLFSQVSEFKSGLAENQAYWALLGDGAQFILNSEREDDVLEQLIPIWSQQRGIAFSKDKPIDEFYREVEYYTLWCLIIQSATQQSFTSLLIRKMRAIIRRYSNMPALWYFLCQISGEELKTAYTF